MQLGIRTAMLTDIPAITAIYAPAVLMGTASYEIDAPDEAEMARRFTVITQAGRGYPYVVAELGGTIAGFAYAGPYRARAAYAYNVEDSIYIAPHAQGQGVGKALLASLISQATTAGFRQMIAVVGDISQPASLRLHQAQGFEIAGTLKGVGYKFGRWLDGAILQRSLGPGAATQP